MLEEQKLIMMLVQVMKVVFLMTNVCCTSRFNKLTKNSENILTLYNHYNREYDESDILTGIIPTQLF